MNIKKFQITDDGFEWSDIAHDDTIRFMVGDEKYFDVKINKETQSITINGDNRGGVCQFKIQPICSNRIVIGW